MFWTIAATIPSKSTVQRLEKRSTTVNLVLPSNDRMMFCLEGECVWHVSLFFFSLSCIYDWNKITWTKANLESERVTPILIYFLDVWQTDYVCQRNATSYPPIFYASAFGIHLSGRCTLVSSRRPLLVDDADIRLFFSFSSSVSHSCLFPFVFVVAIILSLVSFSLLAVDEDDDAHTRALLGIQREREMWRHSIILGVIAFRTEFRCLF